MSQWFLRFPEHVRSRLVLLGLTGLVLFSLWQVTKCDFVTFDDTEYVVENFHVQQGVTPTSVVWALQSNHASNWHPLTWVSHMIDYSWYGANPGGHHFTSLLLHLFATLMLFLVLKDMTDGFWRSAFVAALFGIHPMHVESVAWISERKDVLSACFGLLTVWFYSRYARGRIATGGQDVTSRAISANYFWALVCFCLGLMAKPMLVTLPFVLLLLDFWPLQRYDTSSEGAGEQGMVAQLGHFVLEKTPLFVLAFTASVATYLVQDRGGAVSPETLGYRLSNAFTSYVRYLWKLIWPAKLAVFYPLPDTLEVTAGICSFLVIVGLTVLILVRTRKHQYLFTGWFWFLGMLVPVIGFVQVGSQAMADRYSYLPSIGFFTMITWAACEVLGRNRWLPLFAIMILVACVVMTQRQVSFWRNSVTLFSRVFAVNGESERSRIELGAALAFCGRFEDSIPQYQRAVELNPKSDLVHLDWGVTLIAMGKNREAISHLEESLRLKPNQASAHDNLAIALTHLKRYPEAEEEFRKALALKPNNPAVLSRLGFSLMEQKKFDDAELTFLQALRLNPSLREAHVYLGYVYSTEDKFDQAIEHCRAAVRLAPDDLEGKNNLQIVISKQKSAAQGALKHN